QFPSHLLLFSSSPFSIYISFLCSDPLLFFSFFFFNDPATTEIYTLSLHDALPILIRILGAVLPLEPVFLRAGATRFARHVLRLRSEEHTSELQSRFDLVCRLLLEKKKKKQKSYYLNKKK